MSGKTPRDILRAAGLANPAQVVKIIHETVDRLELDLSGLAVLTEAASGPYVVTPIIAAVAGADRVIALTRDSSYATSHEVIEQTDALWTIAGVKRRIETHVGRPLDLFGQADVVTNLGFVRPLDRAAVEAMKRNAVIALMCESWEFRPGDLDLATCAQRGIGVFGTDESLPTFDIFSSSGWLCLKLLADAQIAPARSTVVIVSGDKFGRVIEHALRSAGANVVLLPALSRHPILASADAIVIADYRRTDMIIGEGGDLTSAELAASAPSATVIQFAGRVDAAGIAAAGLAIHPPSALPPHRMSVTLAGLGPRLVIELHAAGLKVGQIANDPSPGPWRSLSQPMTDHL